MEKFEEPFELPPEFDINNFPDLSEHGRKEQCAGCHEWDYLENLTSEDGLLYYHPRCEREEFYL